MTKRRTPALILGLILALSSFPVLADEPAQGQDAHFVAVSKLPSPEVQQRLDKLFYRWDSYELDLPALEKQVRETGRVTLHAGSRVFDLKLEVNNLRAPGYKRIRLTRSGSVEERLAPVATFKGHVAGDPESVVRLLIQKDLLLGLIRTGDEWIFIDPLRKYDKSAARNEIVLFDDDDVRPEAAALCGAGELIHRAHDLTGSGPSSNGIDNVTDEALISPPVRRRFDIAVEADYEFYLVYGSSTSSTMEGIINVVDGIYKGELALTLRISDLFVWTVDDPYTDVTTSTNLLNEFRAYWNANRTGVTRDVAHLFTNKDTANVAGQAFLNVVCNSPSSSYGFSHEYSLLSKITAHEIGHNFNAPHDSTNCSGSGFLMCPALQPNGPYTFSNPSKTAITSHVNSYNSCLDALPLTYYTTLTNQTPDTTLAGTGYEAGNQFSSNQDGYITALRFWKACGETGTHTGRLWTNGGQQLASVTFTNESSCGWQEQYLPYRVKVTAGTKYWVTYNENAWQSKTGCGLSSPISNGPLTVWGGAYSNASSPGTFPTNGSCSNFFADVYFTL
jgi:hypothetical protein